MILSKKSKKDFIDWLCKSQRSVSINYGHGGKSFISEINGLPANEIVLNHYYIEWFDSVGIFIEIGGICRNWDVQYDYNIQENNTMNGMNGRTYPTHQQATEAAIK